jgi:hypothetical protein
MKGTLVDIEAIQLPVQVQLVMQILELLKYIYAYHRMI